MYKKYDEENLQRMVQGRPVGEGAAKQVFDTMGGVRSGDKASSGTIKKTGYSLELHAPDGAKKVLGGAAVGGTVGGTVGFFVAGPPGAVLGANLGVAAGATAGGLLSRKNN